MQLKTICQWIKHPFNRIQRKADELCDKVDEFLGTDYPKVKVYEKEQYIDLLINTIALAEEQTPAYTPLLKKLLEEMGKETYAACTSIIFLHDVIINKRRLDRIEKDRSAGAYGINRILAHEIAHDRIHSLRGNKRFNDEYATSTGVLHSLNEGFADYVADKILGLNDKSVIKTWSRMRTEKVEQTTIQGFDEELYDGLVNHVNSLKDEKPNVYSQVSGYHFCTAVDRRLGKQHVIDLMLNPIKPDMDVSKLKDSEIETLVLQGKLYKISQEELEKPELYIARISGQAQTTG